MAERDSAAEDLKRVTGGIVDIEFMVQYLLLARAHRHPTLTEHTDNIRILETVDRLQPLSAGVAHSLREAYLAVRAHLHRDSLGLPGARLAGEVPAGHRANAGAA
jgi:glutamate-ammonia-ligase adenylyltransferase